MKRVSSCCCAIWAVVRSLARGFIIYGTAVLPLHSGALASDEALRLSTWDVLTLQLLIGEPKTLAAGDFNGDGSDDLFIVSEIKRPELIFGVLGPAFLPSAEYEIRFFILSWQGEEPEEPRLIGTLAAPNQVVGLESPIVADLDRDGHQDVVVPLGKSPIPEPPALFDIENVETHLLLFWNQGDGTFVQDRLQVEQSLIPAPTRVPRTVICGDFNSDDLPDIAYLDPRNLRLRILYNQGDRSFTGPDSVPLQRVGDECIPIAMNLRAAWVDETRPGDDIVVSGPCYYAEDRFNHFVRVIFSCGTDCWEASPLLLTEVQMPSFLDALWDIAVGDFNGDGHTDILVLGDLHVAEAEPRVPGVAPPVMDIYLLPGDGRGQFGPPQFAGWSEKGRFLFVDAQPEGEWSVVIVVLTEIGIRTGAWVVRVSRDWSQVSSTTLGGRGLVVDGAVLDRGTGLELVLLASLDYESGVTLVNVVRGW